MKDREPDNRFLFEENEFKDSKKTEAENGNNDHNAKQCAEAAPLAVTLRQFVGNQATN